MKQQQAPAIRATRLDAADEEALAQFHRTAWNTTATAPDATRVTRKIGSVVACPFTASLPAPAVGVYDGTQIIGYLSSIPAEFWDGKRLLPAHWLKGFMVLPERRNGPIGFMLVKRMLEEVATSGAMVVAPNARRLLEALGLFDAGAVPNYMTLTRPVRFFRALDTDKLGIASLPGVVRKALRATRLAPFAWLCGGVASGVLGVISVAGRLSAPGLRTRLTAEPPPQEQIDRLWEKLRTHLNFAPSRSGAYVAWRYAGENLGRYEFISVYSGAELRALAVVRRAQRNDDPRLAGLRLGLVVDLVLDPSDTRAAVVALVAARTWGRQVDCDAVLLTISHAAIGRLAIKVGYARIPGNVHCLLRERDGELGAIKGGLERSWLTRGDAWGDDI
jgi:GNAT superfamily N-acetyltransferase